MNEAIKPKRLAEIRKAIEQNLNYSSLAMEGFVVELLAEFDRLTDVIEKLEKDKTP